MGHGFGGEPTPHVRAARLRIVHSAAKQPARVDGPVHRGQLGRRGIEGVQALGKAVRGRIAEIGLGHDDAVGDRRLLDRFGVGVERSGAGGRIDRRDHRLEAKQVGDRRVGHQGVQDRRRVGQSGRFDDDALERRDRAGGAPCEEAPGGAHQIAAHGAAHAAAVEQDDLLVARLDQQMVEPDLAELVDDHGGARERRVAQQAREQRRLAAAEEAGDHRDRNCRHRQRAPASRPRTCCVPITRRPAGASGASSSRSRRSRPGSPAWRPSGDRLAGSRVAQRHGPAGRSIVATRISGPVPGAMTNPFASSGSGPIVPATPQTPSAPKKRARSARAMPRRSARGNHRSAGAR